MGSKFFVFFYYLQIDNLGFTYLYQKKIRLGLIHLTTFGFLIFGGILFDFLNVTCYMFQFIQAYKYIRYFKSLFFVLFWGGFILDTSVFETFLYVENKQSSNLLTSYYTILLIYISGSFKWDTDNIYFNFINLLLIGIVFGLLIHTQISYFPLFLYLLYQQVKNTNGINFKTPVNILFSLFKLGIGAVIWTILNVAILNYFLRKNQILTLFFLCAEPKEEVREFLNIKDVCLIQLYLLLGTIMNLIASKYSQT